MPNAVGEGGGGVGASSELFTFSTHRKRILTNLIVNTKQQNCSIYMNKLLYHSTETKTLTTKKTEAETNVYKSELVQYT